VAHDQAGPCPIHFRQRREGPQRLIVQEAARPVGRRAHPHDTIGRDVAIEDLSESPPGGLADVEEDHGGVAAACVGTIIHDVSPRRTL
jgi:hypothetical protein